jgi:hypothetical protein
VCGLSSGGSEGIEFRSPFMRAFRPLFCLGVWAHNADIAMLIRMRVRFMSALIPSATAMLAGKTSRCCDVGHIEVCLGTA